jgi:Ran GTPase-activating protein (RanGAP) involved in mRNA processing and transport
MNYIKALERSGLMPETLGFVRTTEKAVLMKDMCLGDKYAKALATGLEGQGSTIETLNLRGNRLSGKGASRLLSRLDPLLIREIDLSHNNLGPESMDAIAKLLEATASLRTLEIESCNLTTSAIRSLCAGMDSNISVARLNLANNGVSNEAATPISKMLAKSLHLESLDLNYNKIRGQGGTDIFKSLNKNKFLVDLNLSWNSMGSQRDPSAESLSQMIFRNTTLKHLDISYNKYSFAEMTRAAQALKVNHVLLGVHVEGN